MVEHDGWEKRRSTGMTAPDNRLLTVDNVSFAYAQRPGEDDWVLRGLNLFVRHGELVCLLGPSGCGKSTLLQLVCGFLQATDGSVWMEEAPVTAPGPDRALVSQEPTLYPWFNVIDNVALPLAIRGVARDERRQRAQRVLHAVGLPTAGSLLPHQLSGGMKQRVMVARALLQEPRLLLMDEPFSALDAYTREQMQHEILRLWHRTRMTILFTTHDIQEAVTLGVRAIVMSARPARIIREIPLDFGRRIATEQIPRHRVQASPEFVTAGNMLREAIHTTSGVGSGEGGEACS